MARGDVSELRQVAASARKWIKDAQSALENSPDRRENQAGGPEAGLQGVGVSVDGLEELHDRLRGVPGSFAAAFRALRLLRAHGLTTSLNTQLTSYVIPHLREMFELFVGAGAKNWQVQLTVAMGRAADRPELLLQPYQLLELMPLLAELFRAGVERGMLLQPGNNLGYFGPYEALWRGSGDDTVYWPGCNAGENTMGIEADGTIKGCPSMPTVGYAGGNVRELTLADFWRKTPELNFNLTRAGEELWGYCRGCYYADVCRGVDLPASRRDARAGEAAPPARHPQTPATLP